MLAAAHIPLERGGAHCWLQTAVGSELGENGAVEIRKNELKSTLDAVDDGFKLRSHAQRSCLILAHISTINKIKFA